MNKPESVFEINEDCKNSILSYLDGQQVDVNSFITSLITKCRSQEADIENFKADAIDIFALCDAIGNGVYVVDNSSVIISSNEYYDRLTGLWKNEYLNKPVKYVLERFFYNSRAVATEALRTGKKATGIGRSKRTDKDFLVTAIPILDPSGRVREVISVLRDITELVGLQAQLKDNIERTELYREELNYYRALEKDDHLIIGSSESMEDLKNLIPQIAAVESTILIYGETGVGKEVIAREVHSRSSRRSRPYIKVNCAAIPSSLLESELFGYEKGAFTGASGSRKLGMFEMANGGTILLDEIGEMPLELQPKLLRVIQDRELYRLGGTEPVKLDIRVIASTNRDLKEAIEKGTFRKDLYYRLCVIPVFLPALRERRNDIPILANYFLTRLNRNYRMTKRFTEQALKILSSYDWPGNVRELENVVERLIVVNRSESIDELAVAGVLGSSLLDNFINEIPVGSLKNAVDSLERTLIEKALKDTGSTYRAAEILGITQSTVVRKAQRLGIEGWK